MRPKTFDDFVGNQNIIDRLSIIIEASKKTNEALKHICFTGPAGLGKTTLAYIVANELGVDIEVINGANVRSIKQLAPAMTRRKSKDILFIDEIHRLPIRVEEALYHVMEDNFLLIGRDEDQIKLKLSGFTLIGATTLMGKLSAPLRDRFTYKFALALYSEDELSEIIKRDAERRNVSLDDASSHNIAKRARGTARIALAYFEWVYSYSLAEDKSISNGLVNEAMDLAEIDEKGFTEMDRQYIQLLKDRGIVSLSSIAHSLNISTETVQETIEPYLIRNGTLTKSSKGRALNV